MELSEEQIEAHWAAVVEQDIVDGIEMWLDRYGDVVDDDKKEILEITYKFFSGKDYQKTL